MTEQLSAIAARIVERAATGRIAVLLRRNGQVTSLLAALPHVERIVEEDGAELVGVYSGAVDPDQVIDDIEWAAGRGDSGPKRPRPAVATRQAPASVRRRGHNRVDHTGERYGSLVIDRDVDPDPSGNRRFWCKCDCGNECVVALRNLRHKHWPKTHCGCQRRRPRRTAPATEKPAGAHSPPALVGELDQAINQLQALAAGLYEALERLRALRKDASREAA